MNNNTLILKLLKIIYALNSLNEGRGFINEASYIKKAREIGYRISYC
ncbi:MAG: hypothetical protein ACJA0H_002474, partial [Francisellaceae bacterium]